MKTAVQMTPHEARYAFRRILVAGDLSRVTDAALKFALDLARRTGAQLKLITVLGQLEGDAYSPIRYSPEAAATHESVLGLVRSDSEALLRRHDTTGIPIEITVQKGHPLHCILKRAGETKADLLVVGAHNRKKIEYLVVGSTESDIVSRAGCSVLVVREEESLARVEVKRVLATIDLSSNSESLLRYAAGLARCYGAALDVLHVIEPIPLLDTLTGAMPIRGSMPDLRTRAKAEMEALLRRADSEGIDVRTHVEEGQAALRIVHFAEDEGSNLIVIGREGRSAIERALIGSVARSVVRHARCPVLVAKIAAMREEVSGPGA